MSIDINRKKVTETTPEFERLKSEHEKVTAIYESVKETMIETKRKKQEILDKITSVERDIRDKNKSRDITILAVKECQRETQEYMQKSHDEMLKLEEDIYEKGCRLETLEDENERFKKVLIVLLLVVINFH
jgi:chromosome segregation ATPase